MNEVGVSVVSISTVRSFSFPSCSMRRRLSRVALSGGGAAVVSGMPGRAGRTGGSSRSSRRSSAFSWARERTRSRSSSRSIDTAVSARSRTMLSTSRPT